MMRKFREFLEGFTYIAVNGEKNERRYAWVILSMFTFLVFTLLSFALVSDVKYIETSSFVTQLENGNVNTLHISVEDGSVRGTFKEPVNSVEMFESLTPLGSDEFVKMYLSNNEVKYDFNKTSRLMDVITRLALTIAPTIVTVLAIGYIFRKMDFTSLMLGRDNDAPIAEPEKPDMKFSDVCGVPEALEEMSEIVSFLRSPAKYHAAGAKIPKGVLLQGPSGVGKTMLARALAGEAGVPFYAASGSDFIEMFVGRGAARIRQLFKIARANQPCIIFIDEIDALGGNRDGMSSGHGYTEEHLQTMNQLLAELDGFDKTDTIVVIGATNRAQTLDPALLRPGRFDRHITVDLPTKEGRKQILQHYAVGKPFAHRVDFDQLAAHTYGFSGAQLESVINNAATMAARRAIEEDIVPLITPEDIEEGIARVMSGPAMKSRKMSDLEREQVAYHEAGHAVVQYLLPNCKNVQKISIVSRSIPSVGTAMGYVQTYSEEDSYVTTADECRDEIASLLAGRCSEQIFCSIESAGASNDLERATDIANKMVTSFAFLLDPSQSPLSRDRMLRTEPANRNIPSSQTRMQQVDDYMETILHEQFDRAWGIILENEDKVKEIVRILLEKEQIDSAEIEEIMSVDYEVQQ